MLKMSSFIILVYRLKEFYRSISIIEHKNISVEKSIAEEKVDY